MRARAVTHILVLASLCSGCQPGLRAMGARVFSLAHATIPEDRLTAPHGITAVRVNGPIAWIVPVSGGVVLVDSGFDESGAALKRALAGRTVRAVLLTHGHPDHVSGAHLFRALVYVGRDDAPIVTGDRQYPSPILIAARALLGAPPPPERLLPVADGEVVEVGGARFTAIHLPGHTPGATAWLYRDVLFSGDAVVGPNGHRLQVAFFFFSESYGRSVESLTRLLAVDFRWICDGHFGCTKNAKAKLRAAIPRHNRTVKRW